MFVSAVYADCKDDACNKQRDEELKKSKVKAKIFTKLFYRHWNAFTEFKRSHLFVIPADATVEAGVSPALSPESQPARLPLQKNAPRDLTPGYSPDGKYLAWRSQARPGFEADKWRLLIYEHASAKLRDRTERIDLSVGSFAWGPIPYRGAYAIVFTAENHGNSLLYALPSDNSLQDLTTHSLHADDVVFAPNGNLS